MVGNGLELTLSSEAGNVAHERGFVANVGLAFHEASRPPGFSNRASRTCSSVLIAPRILGHKILRFNVSLTGAGPVGPHRQGFWSSCQTDAILWLSTNMRAARTGDSRPGHLTLGTLTTSGSAFVLAQPEASPLEGAHGIVRIWPHIKSDHLFSMTANFHRTPYIFVARDPPKGFSIDLRTTSQSQCMAYKKQHGLPPALHVPATCPLELS
ncbi:hypothetical protein C8Q73DRAFT_314433 [Cubamyces lactineus]|nr:hypothetical protein C8Q73DRAFT_314433 [Cubamyces lactineus]